MRRTIRSSIRWLEMHEKRALLRFRIAPYGENGPATIQERRNVNRLYKQWERHYYHLIRVKEPTMGGKPSKGTPADKRLKENKGAGSKK